MERILLVGVDPSLLDTRAAVLARTGADVAICHASDLPSLAQQDFDLVTLCHTLSEDTRRSVTRTARTQWPNARILQVFSSLRDAPAPATLADDAAPTNPAELLAHTRDLLNKTPRSDPAPSQPIQTH